MKNQYVGDIGDYGKYGLLRFFANQGIRIGVNWYLTKNDGSDDGRFTSYLNKPDDRRYDPDLYDALQKMAFCPDKSVEMIEEAGLIPNALYYGQLLDIASIEPVSRKCVRRMWHNNGRLLLQDAELVYLDPDNGLLGRKSVQAKDSEKFVLPSEIVDYYNAGQNVVYYCHKGRRKWDTWEAAKLEMKNHLQDAQIIVLTYRRGTQRSYIFVVHPDDYKRYLKIIASFERTYWQKIFWREPVGGTVPGKEEEEAAFRIELSDGTVLTLSKMAEGTISISTTRRPNDSVILTPEQFYRCFHI